MYEVRVFKDGEELTVSEVDQRDSSDPDCVELVVYVFKEEQ
jgi:hypothetical protein